jgi:hypothetical protein
MLKDRITREKRQENSKRRKYLERKLVSWCISKPKCDVKENNWKRVRNKWSTKTNLVSY